MPPTAFSIRELGPADEALMRGLLRMFGRAFNERDTYEGKQPGRDYLRRLLASDTFIALCAMDGDVVAGGLAGYVLHKFEQERSEVYIYDLAVDEACRRRGIATALIEHVRRVAAQRGAYVVFVQADAGDEPAISLYSKLGTREEVVHFDMPTDPTG